MAWWGAARHLRFGACLVPLLLGGALESAHAQTGVDKTGVDENSVDENSVDESGIELSGWLLGRMGYGVNPDHHRLVLNQQLLQVEVQHPDVAGWQFDAKVWAEHESALEPTTYRDLTLREFTISKKTSDYSLTLGRQIVVWGKADGFKLLDVVNPLDLREFILNDDLRSRLPLWMGNVQLFPNDQQEFQFLLIPETYNHRIPPSGSEFDFTASLPATGATVLPLEVPAWRPSNWSFGARWGMTLGDWNVGAVALRNLTSAPIGFITSVSPQGEPVIRPRVVERTVIGATADTSLGDAVLRLELAVSPDEYRSHASPTGVPELRRETAVRSLVGVDWNVGNWFISPQIFNVLAPGSPGVVTEPDGTYASLVLERKFYFDKLTLRMFATSGLDRRDYWVSGSARYQFSDQLELSMAVDILGGDPTEFFGKFGRNDRVVAGATIYF
jgi:hypothetical protein